MGGHVDHFPVFLMEPKRGRLAGREVVFNFHADDGTDTPPGVDERADHRAIAQAADCFQADRFDELANLSRGEDGRFAFAGHLLGPADDGCRVRWHDLFLDQVIEEHPQRGQVLLDCRH